MAAATEKLSVGDISVYPSLSDWRPITMSLPERVALEWVKANCPSAEIAGYKGVTAQMVCDGTTPHSWCNKLGVVVEAEVGKTLVILRYDAKYWLLRIR